MHASESNLAPNQHQKLTRTFDFGAERRPLCSLHAKSPHTPIFSFSSPHTNAKSCVQPASYLAALYTGVFALLLLHEITRGPSSERVHGFHRGIAICRICVGRISTVCSFSACSRRFFPQFSLTFSAVTAPLDTIKIRLQLQLMHGTKTPVLKVVTQLLRREGVSALWKGNVPAEILYILYGGSQFASYSVLDKAFCQVQSDFNVNLPLLFHSLFVGSGSGLVSTLVTYPFDLLRTHLAANNTKLFVPMTAKCREIYANFGVLGFFSGLRPSLLTIVSSTGVFFMTYSVARDAARWAKKEIGHEVWGVEAICGFVAGTVSKATTFPLDTIRKRMQISHRKRVREMLVEHWKLHGLRGFYSGFGVSLLKTAPTSALSMAIYEYTITATRKVRAF